MNKNTILIIAVVLILIFVIYQWFQLKKALDWQSKTEDILKKKNILPVTIDTKAEVIESKLNKPAETIAEEKAITEDKKEAVVIPLSVNEEALAKQKLAEEEQRVIDLIAKPFNLLDTKTLLNNHIKKLNEVIGAEIIKDEAILKAANDKIAACNQYLTNLATAKKKTSKKDDKEDEGSGETEDKELMEEEK